MNGESNDIARDRQAPLPDSAEELQIAFAAARMGVWQRDLDSMALTCTAQCKANFGLAPDALLDWAQLIGELIHPDDREPMQAAVRRAIDTHSDYDTDYRVLWPDGSLHWIVSRGRAGYDESGTATRLTGITLDVTERKRAEQLADEQSRLLEMIAAGTPYRECLGAVTEAVKRLHPAVRACVLLANGARDAVGEVICAHLPDAFGEQLVGAPINELSVGTCGHAIQYGHPVACKDIDADDELWSGEWRALCLAHGIHACRSTPIFDRQGQAIGSFFLCFSRPHEADAWELQLSAFGAHLVSVVNEHEQSANALARSEAQLQAELQDTRLLQRLGLELAQQDDAAALYEKVVEAATTIMHSQYASMQVLYPERGDGGELRLLAFRGFNPAAAEFWEWVRADSASTCGEAFRTGQRAVASDVGRCGYMAGSEDLAVYLDTGIRAVQTTPLHARDGRLVGMLSTHWNQAHAPSERDLRLFDILCRQAADLIERQRAADSLRESEARYHNLFESIDEGFCVIEVLFGDDGDACDYRFLEVNPAFERHTGFHGATGRSISEMAGEQDLGWFENYGEVARSGEPMRFQHHSSFLHRWFDVYAFRIGKPDDNTVAVLFTDITANKRSEDALRESEARFRRMADHAPMMVWMTDSDGQATFLSQSWYAYTGQAEGTGTGRGWLDMLHRHDRERVHEVVAAADANAEPFRVEYRLRHNDGSYRWVLAVASPRLDEAGRLLGHTGSLLDIHERKLGEDDTRFLSELGERIRQARDVDRLMADTTAVLGRHLHATRCYFAEIFEDEDRWRVIHDYHDGLPSIVGDYPISVFSPEVLEHMRSGRMLVSEDTRSDPRSAAHYESGYKPIGVRAHAILPLLRGGEWVSNLVAASDRPRQWTTRELGLLETVADRVWNARERLQGEQALREADRRKDEFLATLSHELRNPLAPLRNCLQILRMKGPTQIDGQQLYEVMERQLAQLVRLVNDLLDIARITRGKIELQCELIDIAEVVERAIETSRPVIDQHGHHLVVDLPRHPLRLVADPLRLAQVLSNLLNNAAKYTEPGGRITLAAQRDGEEAVLTVHDTGVGIAAENLGDVFDLFNQADTTLGRGQGGLGIGLTLVRNLVELHGGRVYVRSEGVGQGSEFEVRLPASHASDRSPVDSDDAQGAVADSRHRVLVVDDNREHADSLAMLLGMSGHHVRTAYDGAEGVSAAATFDPDAVLLDIGMPKLDGYEACRRIRGQPGGEHKVMIAVTGWGQDEDRRRGEAAGFDAHLVKPVDPAGLLQVMDTLQRARQEA